MGVPRRPRRGWRSRHLCGMRCLLVALGILFLHTCANVIREFAPLRDDASTLGTRGAGSRSAVTTPQPKRVRSFEDRGIGRRAPADAAARAPGEAATTTGPLGLRTLLYVTTHMSASHAWFLEACWPAALRHSLLLNSSDVVVYFARDAAVADEDEDEDARLALLRRTFRRQRLTIRVRPNRGWHASASAALDDAVRGGWWDGYDWVVRVNPDVVVRDDAFLLRTLREDPDAAGVFVNCVREGGAGPVLLHTDFFALRPAALLGVKGDGHKDQTKDAFLRRHATGWSAERRFTDAVAPLVAREEHRWLAGARPTNRKCRAGTGRDVRETPVVHFHPKMLSGGSCPVPFD